MPVHSISSLYDFLLEWCLGFMSGYSERQVVKASRRLCAILRTGTVFILPIFCCSESLLRVRQINTDSYCLRVSVIENTVVANFVKQNLSPVVNIGKIEKVIRETGNILIFLKKKTKKTPPNFGIILDLQKSCKNFSDHFYSLSSFL